MKWTWKRTLTVGVLAFLLIFLGFGFLLPSKSAPVQEANPLLGGCPGSVAPQYIPAECVLIIDDFYNLCALWWGCSSYVWWCDPWKLCICKCRIYECTGFYAGKWITWQEERCSLYRC